MAKKWIGKETRNSISKYGGSPYNYRRIILIPATNLISSIINERRVFMILEWDSVIACKLINQHAITIYLADSEYFIQSLKVYFVISRVDHPNILI